MLPRPSLPRRRSVLRLACLLLTVLPLLPAAAPEGPRRVLVVTVTTGFRHSCIPLSEQILERMAREDGRFAVDFVRQPEGMPRPPSRPRPGPTGEADPAHQEALRRFADEERRYRETWMPRVEEALRPLHPANLARYDAVLFASTTGDLPLPDKQGFIDWIASGRAFIGVHAATDTFHGFRPFIEMIGGEFLRHGPQVAVEGINDDPAHPSGRPLPARWPVFDEIYQFKSHAPERVHSLLRLDRLMLTAEDIKAGRATPGHYPLAWARRHGQGRVFYTALGHREDLWDPGREEKGGRRNPPEAARLFQAHLRGGILWALGLEAGRP